jgi:hypothetical protein
LKTLARKTLEKTGKNREKTGKQPWENAPKTVEIP